MGKFENNQPRQPKKKKHVLNWIFSIFCLTAPTAFGFSVASVLLVLTGIFSMPIKPIRRLWAQFLPKKLKWIKTVALALVFFIGCSIAPTNATAPEEIPDPSYQLTVTETVGYSEATTAPETTTEAIVETAAPIATEAPVVPDIPTESTFSVHFIDVGQADAALIECDGHYMLIDGGNKADSNVIYSVLKNEGVEKLDIVVGTHAHEDHIGGIPGAFNYTTADITLCPVTAYDSNAFDDFAKYADQNGGGITVPSVGDAYQLGSATVSVLGVNSEDDTNNSSIVLMITYGETSFLFTGDAEREAEEVILNSGVDLSAAVLKVGHHGSETSTSYPFLREVMPQYAIISVGTDNSYGHPTEECLSKLRDADVTVYRTDLQGDIYCTSDGKTVTFATDRNTDIDTLAAVEKESEPPTTEAPTETPTEAPAETEPQEEMVWIPTKGGKKYHSSSSCSGMDDPEHVTISQAKARGFTPCKRCY